MCLSCLFKEIQPFENYKIHRNVLEIHFSHDPKLPGTCMYECKISLGDTCQNSLGVGGGSSTTDVQPAIQPSIHTNRHHSDQISRSALRDGVTKNGVHMSKYERIFNFKLCIYPAYFRSYSHLKIVKCIAMY